MNNKKTLYVLIVSRHNLPEYRACKLLQPTQIVLVASDSMREEARRLQLQLEQMLGGQTSSKITVLPKSLHSMQGDKYDELVAWIEQEFKPFLSGFDRSEWQFSLNFTGGTKLQSHLLKQAWQWDEAHYLALDHGEIQVIQNGSDTTSKSLDLTAIEVSPLDHARLYNSQVSQKSNKLEKKFGEAMLVNVARVLMEQQQLILAGKPNPWQQIETQIEQRKLFYGYDGEDKYQLIPWDDLTTSDRKPIVTLINSLNLIGKHIKVQDDGLLFPTSKHRQSLDWRKFIAGDWFEVMLTKQMETLIAKTQISVNLTVGDKKGDTGYETDILANFKGRLWVFEAKVGLAKGPREVINQHATMLEKYGKPSGALLLAPGAFFELKTAEKRLRFLTDCEAAGFKPCLIANTRHLEKVFNPKTIGELFPVDTEQLLQFRAI